ncbi:hypothetical protein TNCV_809481 [Trichonephila clavipes]|uniref:Uncharacterized protein n=1 Tax=Trichonephila clavipes TaxID=2585209 RepID=A0A8X6SBW3_TRICX|nr:hypothetical protein TNCV_809481 [Trichonephila clavipes]
MPSDSSKWSRGRCVINSSPLKNQRAEKADTGATVREYYGHTALSGNVIRTPKVRFQILTPHSKTHKGLTFDVPARARLVATENENPDVLLGCKAFPPNPGVPACQHQN